MIMKGFLWFIGVLVIFSVSSYFYIHSYGIYYYGQSDTFKVGIGEMVTIKFDRNNNGGYWYCWANEKQCDHVKLVEHEGVDNIVSFLGFKGAGGVVRLEFKGIRSGVDTLKIGNCSDIWPADSLNMYDYTNIFIIKVEE